MARRKYTQQQVNDIVRSSVEDAVADMQPNSQMDTGVRARIAAAMSGGYDFADTLHNIYLDFGYPFSLDFFNYWNMYRRFGIARRVVELYPDQTWLDDPIITGAGLFERELERLVSQFGLWRRLQGLDTRQRVGRYAGMFMRVRDGKQPSEPISGRLSGIGALAGMVPLYEGQLEVNAIQDDPAADDYGMPTMYQFNSGSAGNRNEKAAASFAIHPSRIIVASEDSDNGGIYGIPALESVYNSLMDLRKILGGGGEGFYKNSSQNIVFDLKDGASAKNNAALLQKFNEQYDEFSQNRSRRAMWTPGMEAKVLDSSLINPKEFAANSLMDIAAGANIPTTLLVGNQTGRLAGDQDTKGFLAQVQARRTGFGTDMVRATIDWCIRWGLLPSAEYEIEWPDAQAPSAEGKLGNAEKMALINKTQFESGGDAAFSGEEIREQAGFDPEEEPDGLPDETLEDDGEEGED